MSLAMRQQCDRSIGTIQRLISTLLVPAAVVSLISSLKELDNVCETWMALMKVKMALMQTKISTNTKILEQEIAYIKT